ncbi:hypothetical protein ABT075_34995 [Streptomyces sp. NPDC002677]
MRFLAESRGSVVTNSTPSARGCVVSRTGSAAVTAEAKAWAASALGELRV